MAFTTIPSASVQVGEPVTGELLQQVKTNEDDHESRITVLETATLVKTPLEFVVMGSLALAGTSLSTTDLLQERLPFDISVTGVKVTLLTAAGGSGTAFKIDLGYYRGASPWASILSSTIDVATSTAIRTVLAGTVSTSSLLAEDILTVRVTDVGNDLRGFSLTVEYNNV